MKKLLLLCLALVFMLGLTACGDSDNKDKDEKDDKKIVSAEKNTEEPSSEVEPTVPEESSAVAETTDEWDAYYKEFDSVMKDYIDVLKAMVANPTDDSLMQKYEELTLKLTEVSAKGEEMAEAITDTAKKAEVEKKLEEIAKPYQAELQKLMGDMGMDLGE